LLKSSGNIENDTFPILDTFIIKNSIYMQSVFMRHIESLSIYESFIEKLDTNHFPFAKEITIHKCIIENIEGEIANDIIEMKNNIIDKNTINLI
jgi:hypothetical protein